MSQENVEIVRRGYERLSSGDPDAFLQLCAAELEFRDLPEFPGSGVIVGHDAYRDWYAALLDAFEYLRFEAEEFIDAGDRIVVVVHPMGRGRDSRADVEMHFSKVWTLSDGKIIRCLTYSDHAKALEAAGLSG